MAIFFVALAVLVEGDVEVCRLLPCLVFAEVCSAPAHHSSVEDAPGTRPDVASIKPHS